MTITPPTRLRPFQPMPFGQYTLLSPLAAGGMGELFLARKGPSDPPCVIKKILPELAASVGAGSLDRFVHEAKALAQLSHPSIARVLDMGIQDAAPFLVIEYVDGKDLRKVAARSRERPDKFPPALTLYVITRVLEALAYAHAIRDADGNDIQLVHRDVSPANILISYNGDVKVIDFGLAKSTLHSAGTNPSLLVGKFLYMSPEQARHQVVDRRSDLYSVGVCLYELIMGFNPFDGLSPAQMLTQVTNPTFLDAHPISPGLPKGLASVMRRALAVDPRARFPTAEALREELVLCLRDLGPDGGPEALSRWMRHMFSAEYASERRLVWAFQPAPVRPQDRVTRTFPLVRPTPDARLESSTPLDVQIAPTPPAVPFARTAVGPPTAEPLSFQPVPRLRNTDDQFPEGPTATTPTQPGARVSNPNGAALLEQRLLEAPSVVLRRRTAPARWILFAGGLCLLASAMGAAWAVRRSSLWSTAARPRPSWQRANEPDFDADETKPANRTGVNGETSRMDAAWNSLTLRFENFRHLQGCSRPAPAALCRRYQSLEHSVPAQLEVGEEDPELLSSMRELTHDLSEATAGGVQ